MATVNLSPIGNGTTFFTATGSVNANGFLSTYQAGTSTEVATYNSSAGTVQNGTSIQLGSDGRPASEIWIAVGTAVKFVLEDSSGNPIANATWDNISGINDDTGLGIFWCGTATGTGNALLLTPASPSVAYSAGVVYYFKSGASANTGASTVNISGLGTIAIQLNGAPLTGGEIQASNFYQLIIDATTTAAQISCLGIPTTINNAMTFNGAVSFASTVNAPIFTPSNYGALVYNSNNVDITNDSVTVLSFDSEAYDTDTIHDTSTNPSRLTVPTGITLIRCKANVHFNGVFSNSINAIAIKKNGSTSYTGCPIVGTDGNQVSLLPYDGTNMGDALYAATPGLIVTDGDYFELEVYQKNGSALNRTVYRTSWFSMEIIG